MRITQGTFSFLPDFTDDEIEAQVRFALDQGWSLSVEHTDDPHPRNSYWEMWGLPLFDLAPEQADVVMREIRACRERFASHYVKVIAYDSRHTRQTTALAFIVNRPPDEPGFRLDRTDTRDRQIAYRVQPYSSDEPPGRRYGARSGSGDGVEGASK